MCAVWGYVFQFNTKQNLCLLQGRGQLDRRGKRWKDEASYVRAHKAFKDSCTAVNLSLSLGAIEEAIPCLFNHLSSAKIILHVLYVYVISFLKNKSNYIWNELICCGSYCITQRLKPLAWTNWWLVQGLAHLHPVAAGIVSSPPPTLSAG